MASFFIRAASGQYELDSPEQLQKLLAAMAKNKLAFQIRTASGAGRTYLIQDGAVRSLAGLSANPAFTLSFSSAATGFEILSAKDAQPAFLRGVGSKDLAISGDFREVLWFQGLTSFLQPPRVIAAWDRSPF